VFNSIAAGRRLAVHIAVWQLGASLLAAALFLVQGGRAALGALLGGALVALGTGLMAWRAFRGGHASAGATLGRLMLGMAMKWVVVMGGFYALITHGGLPPLPTLVGVVAALVIHMVSLRFKD
jgi:F0F1-type ATP synthase assembly protein I